MELRHLRYFVAVAEEQNVTRAAARLHVSQPPLSRQIRALEDELGVALFEHGAKSIRLTDAGKVFHGEASAVLRRAEEAVQTVKAVASGRRGEVHVGYAPSLTVEILPRALRAFQESHPQVRVHLHDLTTEGMLIGLRDGDIQVALMIRPSSKALGALKFEELRRYAVCVAMHPTHPLAQGRKVSLKQVAGERLIGYTQTDYPEYHDWIADLFKGQASPPQISEEHDSATSLIAAVEAGRGVAVVQQGFECLAGPRLSLRKIVPAPAPFVVGVVYEPKGGSTAAMAFIESVKT
ncbi:MAG: LysR family transcriptional regulator [Limisphaerales bacterium]